MNRAATQDLRNTRVLPSIEAMLEDRAGANPREQQMLDLLEQWRADGSSRLDRDLDGKIDAAGAAIMDTAWPKIADAVMSPVLGPQLGELASLLGRDNRPNSQGSAYGTRLVRIRRQGPARRGRQAGRGAVQDALLRGRQPGRVPRSLWRRWPRPAVPGRDDRPGRCSCCRPGSD